MMSNENIKDSYEKSANRMSGDNTTLVLNLNLKILMIPILILMHLTIKKLIIIIFKNPPASMKEVHKWQRQHINKKDQSKDGYPLNVIIDPAMRGNVSNCK